MTVDRIFSAHALTIFDVEALTTHGGSLRIYVKHLEDATKPVCSSVSDMKKFEEMEGYDKVYRYLEFGCKVKALKRSILSFIIDIKEKNKSIVCYGAAAKGNTLLNYCGIGTDFIDYVADKNPYKQGYYLPGSHIPIENPEKIKETKPDYIVILPWNIKDEIIEQLSFIKGWGGKFVTFVPRVFVT